MLRRHWILRQSSQRQFGWLGQVGRGFWISPLSCRWLFLLLVLSGYCASEASAQLQLDALEDVTLATDALLMPISAPYGRSINGVSFQTDNVVTIGDYQYSTWYRARGSFSEDIMLARRDLSSGAIEIMDTGRDLVNGDNSWDAHNVISMGISTADGRIHLSYDHHGNDLNYTPSVVSAATGATWDSSILEPERDSLNVGGSTLSGITYPRYINTPDGGLDMTYRTGGSGNGNLWFANYDAGTGAWNTPQLVITGTNGLSYSDLVNTSTSRNAYLNGVSYDSQGYVHITWTWRESAGGSNHDIMYAYSDDGGVNWKNNSGTIIGGPHARGNPIDLNSPEIIIDDGDSSNGLLGQLDRSNTLMNQQTQTVDPNGFVHVIMWHKTDDAPPQLNPPFTTAPAAYFHYFRDPETSNWSRVELPTSRAVGSRPDVAYDELGNLYVTYISPGPGDGVGVQDYYTDGDLIVAGATRASGYTDWTILQTDTRDFAGEPFVDQNRLLNDGVVSVFVQEDDDLNTGRTGTPLHLIEYTASSSLLWTGGDTGQWDVGSGSGLDWNSRGETTGNARFYSGYRVRFGDNAGATTVPIAQPVAPGETIFENNAQDYTLTGAGITGSGGLTVRGAGRVTLANGANTFTGDTTVADGTLALTGAATIANSKQLLVETGAELDLSGLTSQMQLANGQSLQTHAGGTVRGDLTAGDGSAVSGAGKFVGNLTVQAGATLTVGSTGGLSQATDVLFAEDFNGAGGLLDDTLPDTTIGAEAWEAGETWADDGTAATVVDGSANGEAAHLNFTPENGQVYVAEATITNDQANWIAFGFMPDAPSSGDWTDTDFSVRHSNSASFAWALTRNSSGNDQEGFLGSATGGAQPWNGDVVDPTQPVTLKIVLDTTEDNWTAEWFLDGTSLGPATAFAEPGNPGIGGIGFSHDRSDTANAGGMLSDFSLVRLAQSLDTLLVEGNLSLSEGALLQLDVQSTDLHDLLSVTGDLELGGTLEVSLTADASTPLIGESFQILNFAAASGQFSNFLLPQLTSGMAWDVSDLGQTGELKVVPDVDLDDDGDVDGFDFLAIQRTDGGLLPAWQNLYGHQLVESSTTAAVRVPEPGSRLLAVVLAGVTFLGCQPRKAIRQH